MPTTTNTNPKPAPQVVLADGKLEGIQDGAVESFKGIRFAAAPIAALRWRAPQPVPPWTGILAATHFGADCLQTAFEEDMAPLQTQPAEDCLFLNVWRPTGAAPGAGLPVVVWIYGGGFVCGGSSPVVYHGDAFAKKGVVFVSFNYRLGHFGFFAHPELTRVDADDGLLGNYGHMDQIAALRWVQRNIAAFGGSSQNVTIIGESAGGGSVVGLMTSPAAAGLMHKAMVMSGGGRGLLDGDRRVSEDTPRMPSGETLGLRFAQRHGIDGHGKAALAALRALPAATLAKGLSIPTLSQSRDVFSGQMRDGRILIEATPAIVSGQWAKIPIIVGTTIDEIGAAPALSKAAAFADFGADAIAAEAAYDHDGQASLAQINARIGMDKKMHEPARFLAGAIADQRVPAYLYRFSYVASAMRQIWRNGAPHASDIPFFLGTLSAKYGRSANDLDREVARIAHQCVVDFAIKGDPNSAGTPAWRAFERDCGQLFEFSTDGRPRMDADPLRARLDLVARQSRTP